MRRLMLAVVTASVAVIGCTNDYEAFEFKSGPSAGGSSSGGTTGGGGSGTGGSAGSGTGGVVTGGGGAPTGGGGAPTGGGGAPTGGGGAPTGGGGAPTGGGGAPTGGGGAPTGGGGAPTGGGGAPTGGGGAPSGGGGTGGSVGLPACSDTYGQINGVAQVCLQTDTTCELAYAATTQTCTAICNEGGGVCQGVFNNSPGACGHGAPSDCNNALFQDAVCVCSRGCGSGPPCPGTQVCSSGGNCQG